MVRSLSLLALAAALAEPATAAAVSPPEAVRAESLCNGLAQEQCEGRLRAFWKTRAVSGVKVFCEPEKSAGGELAFTVGEVEPGSAEALAGVRLGDRLLEQDGQPMSRIKSLEELRDLKRQLVAGQETVWLLGRGEKRLQVRFVRPAGSPAWVEEQVSADLKRLVARR